MSDYTSSFLKVMSERNFIHQVTDWKGLDALLSAKAMVAYIGFDCTADSLHVGSLVQIMMLRHFQKCGHRPIVLMGMGQQKLEIHRGKTMHASS